MNPLCSLYPAPKQKQKHLQQRLSKTPKNIRLLAVRYEDIVKIHVDINGEGSTATLGDVDGLGDGGVPRDAVEEEELVEPEVQQHAHGRQLLPLSLLLLRRQMLQQQPGPHAARARVDVGAGV
eukprot:1078884-Rhodomonas_salina.1